MVVVICVKCGGEVDNELMLCPECQIDLEPFYKCKFCGSEAKSEYHFCPKCKKDLDRINCHSCNKLVPNDNEPCPFCNGWRG